MKIDLAKNKPAIEKLSELPWLRVDEALLTLIPLIKTSSPVRVAGKVESVNDRYDQWIYGEISGKESSIRFRIPKEEGCPPVGSQVIITGVFAIRPAKFHEGLETMLSGQIDPKSKEILNIQGERKKALSFERKRPPTRINNWIINNESDLKRFALLGTNVGITDAAAAIAQHGINPEWRTILVSMVNRIDILKAIKNILHDNSITGFALVRGGGPSSTMEVWEDEEILSSFVNSVKPFYAALGHSTDLILLDRIADESFETPSILGSQLGQLVNIYKEDMNLKNQVVELTTKNQELEKVILPIKEQMKSLEDKHALELKQVKEINKIKNYLIIALSVIVLIISVYVLIK